MKTDKAKAAIKSYVYSTLDKDDKDLISMASAYLWHGPFSADQFAEEDPARRAWPGWTAALKEIGELDIPTRLFLSEDYDVAEQEDDTEGWYEFDSTFIRKATFGELVGNGL